MPLPSWAQCEPVTLCFSLKVSSHYGDGTQSWGFKRGALSSFTLNTQHGPTLQACRVTLSLSETRRTERQGEKFEKSGTNDFTFCELFSVNPLPGYGGYKQKFRTIQRQNFNSCTLLAHQPQNAAQIPRIPGKTPPWALAEKNKRRNFPPARTFGEAATALLRKDCMMPSCPLLFVLKHADALSEAHDLRVVRRRDTGEGRQGNRVAQCQESDTQSHTHTVLISKYDRARR